MGIVSEFVRSRGRDHLRDVGVHVQSLKFIAMIPQRLEEGFLVESTCHAEVLEFSRHRIQIAENFSHAAVLSVEYSLHVVIT